jgi:nitrite reductase/ring-hydroxylating ferredoxin subunit
MERKQFLKTLGSGAAFALVFPCVNGCSIEGEKVEIPTGVDFTIDLTSAEASNLQTNGGFILKNLVVIARNLDGNLIAATQVCSHKEYDQVRFVGENGGIFYCDVHGSQFDQDGTPLNQVGSKPAKVLKVYNTELTGDILRIFE